MGDRENRREDRRTAQAHRMTGRREELNRGKEGTRQKEIQAQHLGRVEDASTGRGRAGGGLKKDGEGAADQISSSQRCQGLPSASAGRPVM